VICEPRADQVIWIDGDFVPWHQATIHVSAHHYGFGVFEGVRVYAGASGAAIFRLGDHTKRLFRSARMMKLALPPAFSRQVLDEAQVELVRRNRFGDAYLRPFVFLDGVSGLRPCSRDLSVHVAILGVDWRAREEGRRAGVTLKSSSFTRHPASSLLSKAKANGNYVGGMLALEEAQANGADDALLLDQSGLVTETSGANLFIVRDGELQTPPLSCVLEGITRDSVISLATEAGLRVWQQPLTRDDIYAADEMFLTGTASEVTPVTQVDGRPIGDGAPGPLTTRLSAAYSASVRGHLRDHREWLTPVGDYQAREV
jgi:branched-chain amino acid aminotransferase